MHRWPDALVPQPGWRVGLLHAIMHFVGCQTGLFSASNIFQVMGGWTCAN